MKQTVFFDLVTPLNSATEKLIANFGVKKKDDETLEMEMQEGETIEQAVLALYRLNIVVKNGRYSF